MERPTRAARFRSAFVGSAALPCSHRRLGVSCSRQSTDWIRKSTILLPILNVETRTNLAIRIASAAAAAPAFVSPLETCSRCAHAGPWYRMIEAPHSVPWQGYARGSVPTVFLLRHRLGRQQRAQLAGLQRPTPCGRQGQKPRLHVARGRTGRSTTQIVMRRVRMSLSQETREEREASNATLHVHAACDGNR